MTKKKKKKEALPWCWYCDREFEDEKVLVQHQKAKHFKCHVCHKKLNTIGGLVTHVEQMHKEKMDSVPNALPDRNDLTIEIYGMLGVPEEDLAAHDAGQPIKRQRLQPPPPPSMGAPGAPPLGLGLPPSGPAVASPSRPYVPPAPPTQLPARPLGAVPPTGMPGYPGTPPAPGMYPPPMYAPPPAGYGYPPPPPSGYPPVAGAPPPMYMPPYGAAPPPPPGMIPSPLSPAASLSPATGSTPSYPLSFTPTAASSPLAPVTPFNTPAATPALTAAATGTTAAAAATGTTAAAAAGEQSRLVYSDNELSMEERRANLSKYAVST